MKIWAGRYGQAICLGKEDIVSENNKSLPHDSNNGHHLDVYSYVEGKVLPVKYHEILDGSEVAPKSVEALRQRLNSQKGY